MLAVLSDSQSAVTLAVLLVIMVSTLRCDTIACGDTIGVTVVEQC